MTIARSIVVPCYNEARNIPTLVRRFEAFAKVDRGEHEWELVLVDNGSTDGSAHVLEAELAARDRDFLRVVTVAAPNVGYGDGIMTGLRAARGEFLAWTHADGQTPPADVFRAFELLQSARDPVRTFVKGRRRERPIRDEAFTLGMQIVAAVFLQRVLPDINGQPKAFHRSLLRLAIDPPNDLSLDLYFFWLAREHDYAIRTFDVEFKEREHGESKWAFNWQSKARNVAGSVRFMEQLRARKRR